MRGREEETLSEQELVRALVDAATSALLVKDTALGSSCPDIAMGLWSLKFEMGFDFEEEVENGRMAETVNSHLDARQTIFDFRH